MKHADGWTGPRQLPTLRFGDGEYFIDNRLGEFRTVTPPIGHIESVRFDSEEGLRMLGDCVWLECAQCGRTMVVARQSTESVTWCCECGWRMPTHEHHQPDGATR